VNISTKLCGLSTDEVVKHLAASIDFEVNFNLLSGSLSSKAPQN